MSKDLSRMRPRLRTGDKPRCHGRPQAAASLEDPSGPPRCGLLRLPGTASQPQTGPVFSLRPGVHGLCDGFRFSSRPQQGKKLQTPPIVGGESGC
mmetsp:Transcript_61627/g.190867  ORF Transcript_61627/g.190867 Transcript_61627/m.190867 type:complete len:95 (-) Transcript_61627:56-340(-)